jgi:hypothetical protein
MAIVDQQAKRAPIYQQALINAPLNVVPTGLYRSMSIKRKTLAGARLPAKSVVNSPHLCRPSQSLR